MSHTDLAEAGFPAPGAGRGRRSVAERGLTTVEYAIGLVAAATAALVLLRIFSDNAFFQVLMDWILAIFQNLAGGK